MSRPTLLILSFSPIAADARVLKQVRLFSADYDVTTCGYGPDPEGVVEHVRVPDDLAAWRYSRRDLMLRRYRHAYWSNPAIRWAHAALSGREFDVVLVDDVDPVGLALSLRPRHGVHADLHEYSPRQKEELPRWRWFVAPFIRWMCRAFVSKASSWTTVSRGLATEYGREFGFHPAVVTNATPYRELTAQPVSDPIRLVHSGAALPDRHIDIMIEAAQKTTSKVIFDLYLTPNDPAYVARLRALATAEVGQTEATASATASTRVRVLDPLPYAELVLALHTYDVGLMVLPPVNFSYRWALPNKIFDYVQARLGVIVGPSPEMAAMVTSAGVGAVTTDFTVASLMDALDQLSADQVADWKQASGQHAHELSADSQVAIWKSAIDRLVRGENSPL